jgi:hypothetical protein
VIARGDGEVSKIASLHRPDAKPRNLLTYNLQGGSPSTPKKQTQNIKTNPMNPTLASVEAVLRQRPGRSAYKKSYWQDFVKRNKRVYGTLTKDEYRTIKGLADAESRNVWQQIWQESCHYRNQEKLLSQKETTKLDGLYFILRNIANNINQIAKHSNGLRRLVQKNRTLYQLERLETTIGNFVRQENR